MVGWKNIVHEDYVGRSFGYAKDQTSVGTTNGAGPHNVQMFVLSSDLVVMHALPGFWHPEDLADELEFSKALHRLWKDKSRTLGQKRQMFRRMQLAETRYQPTGTTARSGWQGFDAREERKKAQTGDARDTFVETASGRRYMKPINVLVHERMAKRPFVKFKHFDTAQFVDYGRKFYDNNLRVGDGRGVTVNSRRKNESDRQRLRRLEREAKQRKAELARNKSREKSQSKRRRKTKKRRSGERPKS